MNGVLKSAVLSALALYFAVAFVAMDFAWPATTEPFWRGYALVMWACSTWLGWVALEK